MKEESFAVVFGTKIYEPAVVLTSLVITLLCYFFALRIKNRSANASVVSWKLFFFFMGTGSLIGCIFHGMNHPSNKETLAYLNIARNSFLLLSCFYAFKATLYFVEKNKKMLNRLNLILMIYILAAIVVTIIINHFILVIVNAGIFIIYLLYAHIKSYRAGSAASGWILSAFAIAPLPIAVHIFKIGYGEYINPKDLAHVFIWISLYLIYRGVKVQCETENQDGTKNLSSR